MNDCSQDQFCRATPPHGASKHPPGGGGTPALGDPGVLNLCDESGVAEVSFIFGKSINVDKYIQ